MDRRGAFIDGLVFGGSALVALGIWRFASIPIHREWGALAAPAYAGGGLMAILVALFRPSARAKAALTVAVFAAVALAPLAVQAARRAAADPGMHAQAEVIVTEEAARAAVEGISPYAADYSGGPLADRPIGTRTHFPYLPGMLGFGLPRGLGGALPLADARVGFAAVSTAAMGIALLRWRASPENRVRLLHVVAALPTTAVLLATGGDDVPVVALLLLSAVLAAEGRPGGGGIAAGMAGALKQTAWLVIPFLALAARDERGRAAPERFVRPAVLLPLAVTLPFVAWDPGAFVEDTVLFPLGLGEHPSPAGTPTPGRLVADTFPGARGVVTAVLAAVVAAMGAALLLRRPRTVPGALASAGALFLAAGLLAPAARLGYLVYPVNLLAWAWLMRRTAVAGVASAGEPPGASAGRLEGDGRPGRAAGLLGP